VGNKKFEKLKEILSQTMGLDFNYNPSGLNKS
jgi:hypothetical protein